MCTWPRTPANLIVLAPRGGADATRDQPGRDWRSSAMTLALLPPPGVHGRDPDPCRQHGVRGLPGPRVILGGASSCLANSNRGDRLVFSNGVVLLAVVAAASSLLRGRGHPADPALHRRRFRVVHAEPDRDGPALDEGDRHSLGRCAGLRCAGKQTLNAVGATATRIVFVIVLITKFAQGALDRGFGCPDDLRRDEGGLASLPHGWT